MKSVYTNVAKYGNSILFRGYNQSGNRVTKKLKYKPTLYASTSEDTGWKNLYGGNVKPIKFDDMKSASEFYKQYEDVDNFKIYGMDKYVSQFITEYFPLKDDGIWFNMNWVDVGFFDIEVMSDEGFPHVEDAKYPVNSIVYKSSKSNIYEVWGLKDYDTTVAKLPEGAHVKYRKHDNETDLLISFINFWEDNPPDVMTGWYIKLFDIPYLVNRYKNVFGDNTANKLSPWGKVNYKEIHGLNGKPQQSYEIVGIATLDYKDLFDKFDYKYTFDNGKLDHVASVVLGKKKLTFEEHGSLAKLYVEDHQKYIDYNIRDVSLVVELDAETNLLEQAITIAFRAGANFTDTLGTVNVWDYIIHRYLMARQIVVPPNKTKQKFPYPGGYVKEVEAGRVDWIASFDLNSLYPNLIVQYNMSPETLVVGAYEENNGVEYYMRNAPTFENGDYAVAANGVCFRKDKQGILPEIIVQYYNDRKLIQKKLFELETLNEESFDVDRQRTIDQLNNEQMAIKILLNSLYGAMGNKHFRYFNMDIAKAITLSGQLSIKWAERQINGYMNKLVGTTATDYVVAMDTDSIYLNMNPLIKQYDPKDPVEFIDKTCEKKLVPELEKGYAKLFEHMNAYVNRMVMGREVIADRGVWTAKKRYILNVWDKEGVRYTKPKIKIMGVEAVKSSTPAVCRDKFKEIFNIILTGTEAETQKFIKEFEAEFMALPPEDISFPRGVNDITKWKDNLRLYKEGCPIHVRGSIVYNNYLKQNNLDNVYEEIQDGTKIKFCYMKVPNTLRENVISYPDYIPREHDLHKYVDYSTQFDKAFKEPLRPIVEAMGWRLEKVATLAAFVAK